MTERVHRKACHLCGGNMTEGQLRRQSSEEQSAERNMTELESTYAHLRAVIENCKHTRSVKAVRHQLVGLLPEVRDFDPDTKKQMLEKGMGDLVALHEDRVREAWAGFGFPGPHPEADR